MTNIIYQTIFNIEIYNKFYTIHYILFGLTQYKLNLKSKHDKYH